MEVVCFWMREAFVDVVEINLIFVITINCLQTGDIFKERRSGETAEHHDRVLSFCPSKTEWTTLSVVELNVWLLSDQIIAFEKSLIVARFEFGLLRICE